MWSIVNHFAFLSVTLTLISDILMFPLFEEFNFYLLGHIPKNWRFSLFFLCRVQSMLKERSEYAHVLVEIYNFIGDFISDMSTNEDILQVGGIANLCTDWHSS